MVDVSVKNSLPYTKNSNWEFTSYVKYVQHFKFYAWNGDVNISILCDLKFISSKLDKTWPM